MITPQEIRERTFEKAVFGGYDMATVDAFMEEVASDLTLLQKENAVLKGKMKVLADKVDEYRGNEDALRMAMLTAQRVAASLEKEAKEKHDAVIRDARGEAERIVEEATYRSRSEKEKLDEAKSISAKFIDNMEMLCHRHLDFLRRMNELDFVKQLRAEAAEMNGRQSASAGESQTQVAEEIVRSIAGASVKNLQNLQREREREPEPEIDQEPEEEEPEFEPAYDHPEPEDPSARSFSAGRRPPRSYHIVAAPPEEDAAADEEL